mgnify:CR=1 FL=1
MRPRPNDPAAVLVSIAQTVCVAAPQIPASLVIWSATTSAPTKRLRTMLLNDLSADPARLVAGAPDASMTVQRMILDLTRRGVPDLSLPACSRCGRARLLPLRDGNGGRFCTACRSDGPRACSRCGKTKASWRIIDGQVQCSICFRADPTNHQPCRSCREVTWVAKYGTDGPLCSRCYRQPEAACSRCDMTRSVAALIETEPVCLACYNSIRMRPRACGICGAVKLVPYRRDGVAACASCAGAKKYVQCKSCGTDERRLYGARCAPCALPDKVRALITDPDGHPHHQLLPVEQYLLNKPSNPNSRLEWVTDGAGARILRRMAAGEIAVSLRAVAELRVTAATSYVAALLVESGAVPADDFARIRFEVWLTGLLRSIPDGGDRGIVQQYASWVVKRRFTVAADNTDPLQRSQRARHELTEVRSFLTVIRDAGYGLEDVPQRLYDEYCAGRGDPAEQLVRFLRWARAQHLTRLRSDYRPQVKRGPSVSDDQRWEWVRTLLTREDISLGPRVIGLLTLLFGVPVTRIVTLRRSAVTIHEDKVAVAFGPDPVHLPPRLADLLRRVIDTPPRSPVTDDRWVFRGLRPGAHLANASVSAALRPAGISVQQGRLVALMTLSRDLQPAVVADLIGVTAVTAARWSTHAGGDWADYPQLRDLENSHPRSSAVR